MIADKRTLSEECLRLRHTVSAYALPRREQAEQIAALRAELAACRKEALRNEEAQAAAFNSVVRTLEEELGVVRKERDEMAERLQLLERKLSIKDSLELH